eukprot:TRINITY_DN20902_c0_g1_i5.p1 TRINITY_DN20902_c0_g1~~TRINITY_DN20902_c0_g1_i5.p1  ORF type:complete len:345 (+),score=17.69 TRINITY_DN20902_c0_g1_i5:124-1035(+)
MRPHFLVHKLVDQFCAQIDDANIEGISKSFWSVGILQTRISMDRRRDFRIAIMQRIDDYDIISLTQVFRGMQEMKWRNNSLLKVLCDRTKYLMVEQNNFELKTCVQILNCLLSLEFFETDLIDILLPKIQQNLENVTPRDYALFMNGMLNIHHQSFSSKKIKQQSQFLLNQSIQQVSIFMREISPSQWYLIFDSVSNHSEFLSKNIQFTNSLLKSVSEKFEFLSARQAALCLRLISHASENQVNLQQLDVENLITMFVKLIKQNCSKLGPAASADAILAMTQLGIEDEQLTATLLQQNQTTNF